jgi:hypothetical protein
MDGRRGPIIGCLGCGICGFWAGHQGSTGFHSKRSVIFVDLFCCVGSKNFISLCAGVVACMLSILGVNCDR